MKRNKFSLSNYKLLTGDMGELLPIGLQEVLPGDTIQHSTSALIRVSPLVSPVMHPVRVKIHHWFVPMRLLWQDWEDFITGGSYGSTPPSFPTITTPGGGFAVGSLADYLGVPTAVAGLQVSALPFRAYGLIFNEWYRDQDLISEVPVSVASGSDTTTNTSLLNGCWEKDYFTTARPWPQKGADVSLPLGTSAPVVSSGAAPQFSSTTGGFNDRTLNVQSGARTALFSGTQSASELVMKFGNVTGLQADLSTATASTVNALRRAFALQRMAEARAMYGSRYTEYLRYLGVTSSDARLQRPEYLGGGKQTIQFSEILQTGPNSSDAGVGNLKGHGIGALRSNRYRRYFEEHGFVLSFMVVLPKTIYAQGLPRTFNRRTREDFFQPELQHIGQQQVLNKELYAAHGRPRS